MHDDSIGLDPAGLQAAFPFHFAFDGDLRIVGAGPSLAKIAPELVGGEFFLRHLEVVRPELEQLSVATLTTQPRAIFILRLTAGGVILRGQILHSSASNIWVFL
ncbi:MAG: hypothetical protein ACPG77_11680, partial [Nannocystaceae bacterium]